MGDNYTYADIMALEDGKAAWNQVLTVEPDKSKKYQNFKKWIFFELSPVKDITLSK